MKKYIILLITILLLSGCSIDWNNEKDKKNEELNKKNIQTNSKKIEQINNNDLVNIMFETYCNISSIKNLYSLAPNSTFYKSFVENNSDVSSQKVIAPILLAKREILKQERLINDLNSNSGSYENTIYLLINSDKNIKKFLENMNDIENFNDFKNNMAYLIKGVELFNSIPSEFSKEYIPNKDDAGTLLVNGDIMCNNNDNISFWEDRNNK